MKNHLLRTAIFSFIFVLSSLSLRSQWVSIPDTNFGTWLNTNGYSACMQGNNGVGWQMDTSCPSVVVATIILCSHANLHDINGIQYFDSLRGLNCSNNMLAGLPILPDSLRALDCSYNQISNLSGTLPSLTSLNCSYNQLDSLSALPNGIAYLYCQHNLLTNISALPNGLIYFDCSTNQLNSLPSLPTNLETIYCHNNQLNNLPALPSSLTLLECSFNHLTSLPSLPNSLSDIYCNRNQLTILPTLPPSLTQINCSYNQLTNLPGLPNGLTVLSCDSNQLISLPILPDSLASLNCAYNQLSILPSLPNNLTGLWCSYNQLLSLPFLPGTLRYLRCAGNQISSLPELPDYLVYCSVNDNPLFCLPQIKRIQQLSFYNTNITCLPNYGTVTQSSPPLASVPLCGIFNPNACSVFWNISGRTYYDQSSNCLKDGNDTAQRNIKVELRSGGSLLQQSLSGGEGFYSFDTDSFTTYSLSVDTSNIPFYVSCPANNLLHNTITAIDSFAYSKDFALECKPGVDLAAWSILGWRFIPARYSRVIVSAGDLSNFYGVHCATGVSGNVTATITGPATYIAPAGGALTPTVIANVLTYNIADFGNINFFSDFNIIVETDTAAALGSSVCIAVSVTPTTGDNNPANNTLTHCFTVVGAYDPNDKQVYPTGDIDTAQEWLTYTVRFQNTGTAEAQHIYITDTLDSDLDVSSFQLLAYSHQPMVQLKENAVRFNFPNINLPDSNTNEPLSHGYVQYKIKLKDNLPIGTQINNTAFIYFDFNAPVVTNTTVNTIAVVSGVNELRIANFGLRIYPNPANDAVTISVEEGLIGATAVVTDITGRKISENKLETLNAKLETVRFANGVYFVTVSSERGSITKKLVVSK